METNNEGTQPNPELAPTGTPGPVELATQPAAKPAPTDGQAAVQPNPELAALQAQLAEEREARARFEQQAKDHQAAFTRSQQLLKQAAGLEPKADPKADLITHYLQKGFNEDAAKELADIKFMAINEVAQVRQQFGAVIQGTSQVDAVLNQAFAIDADLLGNAEVANSVRAELLRCAHQGQTDFLTTDYALDVAAMAHRRAMRTGKQPQQTLPVTTQPQQFAINGFTGPQGGFPLPQARQQQVTRSPEQLQLRAELEARMKAATNQSSPNGQQ